MYQFFDVERLGQVVILRIKCKKILDEGLIQRMKLELLQIVDDHPADAYCLDWGGVDYFSTAAAGGLITFDKKVKGSRARLAFYHMRPDIYEVFAITKLNKLFGIYETEQRALEALGVAPRQPAA